MWLAGGRLELAGPDNLLLPESDHHQGQAEGTAAAHEDGEGSIVSLRRAAKDGALRRARALFACAHCEVPSKNTAQVVLECARLEEYVGNGDLARKILRRACQDVSLFLGAHALPLFSWMPCFSFFYPMISMSIFFHLLISFNRPASNGSSS